MEGIIRIKRNLSLGSRIRALRKERRLSLEQLAVKAKVALATLSRMENDKGSGTFRTHQRIADALNLPIPELYRYLQDPEQEATFIEPGSEEAETFTYDENSSAVLLTRQISAKQMLPQMVILQPGGKTTLEQYASGTERWLFGLEGSLEVIVGEKRYQIDPGGTLYFKASLPHHFYNGNAKTAKVISVTNPVGF